MLTQNKRVRFPRAAVARRLLAIMDQLKLYEDLYSDEAAGELTPRRLEELTERMEFLDERWHELELCLRSLQYWR